MDAVRFGVARQGSDWSVLHNGGHLGRVRTRAEAVEIAHMLAEWSAAQGRRSEIELEPAPTERRSFMPIV